MTGLPSAVLFDWDNTLVDTFAVIFESHNKVREALGHPLWSEAQARANVRLAMKEAFPKWYGDQAPKAQDIYVSHFRDNHLDRMEIIDGTHDLLEFLKGQGVPMGIVSNKRGVFLRAEVDKAGWRPYLDTIIGADDVPGPAKPDPAGILKGLRDLGIDAAAQPLSWYVGDTENDIKTAKAAGVIPVFIENLAMNSPEQIAIFEPEMTFRNPRECLAYLRALS